MAGDHPSDVRSIAETDLRFTELAIVHGVEALPVRLG